MASAAISDKVDQSAMLAKASPCLGASPRQAMLAAFAAVGAGSVLGATGCGGGIIFITALTKAPGLCLSQLQAIGMAAGAQGVSDVVGAWAWATEGFCNIPVAACLATGGFGGVLLGLRGAAALPDAALRMMFAGVLVCIICPLSAYSAWNQAQAPAESGEPEAAKGRASLEEQLSSDSRELQERPLLAVRHLALGILTGALFGALSIGDTPVMIAYLSACGFQQKSAIGTALLAAAPLSMFACVSHVARGTVPLLMVPIMMASMSVGCNLGARFSAAELSDEALQLGFSAFVLALGVSTGRSAMRGLA